MFKRIKAYYRLTKPGIIYGNVMTTVSGFLLGSFGVKHHFDPVLGLAVTGGTALVIASACVVNNYFDRDIDKHMQRTNKRALVSGQIRPRSALWYAAVLAVLGFGLLIWQVNTVTVVVGLVGYLDYIWLYAWGKRNSVHGTLIGTISGATPMVAGYTAISNRLDVEAALLFLCMCAWQMPHFYAIAMYRLKDYKRAHLPVMPAVAGLELTKRHILAYTAAFVLLSLSVGLLGYAGYAYLFVMLAVGIGWLWRGYRGLRAADTTRWAKDMFLYSLSVLLVFAVALPVGALLP